MFRAVYSHRGPLSISLGAHYGDDGVEEVDEVDDVLVCVPTVLSSSS